MKFLLAVLASVVLASCAETTTQTLGPKGSDESNMPWNDPGQGPTPGGMLGQMMEGR